VAHAPQLADLALDVRLGLFASVLPEG